MINIDLRNLAGGELGAKFNYAARKVIKNILDPNTSYKTKRSITITLSFETTEDRDRLNTTISVSQKLAPAKPSVTTLSIGRNAMDNQIYVNEIGASIPGQAAINDYDQDTEGNYMIPVEDEETIVDFRKR